MAASRSRVFITGASSGIGAALARRYAASGAILGLVARRLPELRALAAGLAVPCEVYPLDVADADALAAAARHFNARHGVADIVIASAGVSAGTLTAFADDLPAFRRIMDVNVYGMAATFSPFVAEMRQRGSGRLVGVASVAGVRGLPGAGAYSASKAAAIAYLESLRLEMAGSGVRVVSILPGYVATPMTAVNPYPMPFILDADDAARRIARAIEAGGSLAVIPWQMALVATLLRWLPNRIYDALFARAPHKPRGLEL